MYQIDTRSNGKEDLSLQALAKMDVGLGEQDFYTFVSLNLVDQRGYEDIEMTFKKGIRVRSLNQGQKKIQGLP